MYHQIDNFQIKVSVHSKYMFTLLNFFKTAAKINALLF